MTNGVLTGFEIVRYAGDAIVGSDTPTFLGDGRIAYAPVEDLLFGFALVVQTLAWWVWWGRRGVQYRARRRAARVARAASGSGRRRRRARTARTHAGSATCRRRGTDTVARSVNTW